MRKYHYIKQVVRGRAPLFLEVDDEWTLVENFAWQTVHKGSAVEKLKSLRAQGHTGLCLVTVLRRRAGEATGEQTFLRDLLDGVLGVLREAGAMPPQTGIKGHSGADVVARVRDLVRQRDEATQEANVLRGQVKAAFQALATAKVSPVSPADAPAEDVAVEDMVAVQVRALARQRDEAQIDLETFVAIHSDVDKALTDAGVPPGAAEDRVYALRRERDAARKKFVGAAPLIRAARALLSNTPALEAIIEVMRAAREIPTSSLPTECP